MQVLADNNVHTGRCGSVPPKLLLFPILDRSLVARDGAKRLPSSNTGF